ncbi:MAG: hypothetical protein J0I09_03730 [Sphingobacteriia bacterium]|nr:hypothetical protein [Sphingobacteriia bacterium]
MKKIFLLSLIITSVFIVQAQNPVSWSYTVKKVADKTYEIHLKAIIDNNWHIYSQQTPEGGPVPTTIKFNKNPLVIAGGKIKENGKMIMKHEDVFGIDVMYYADSADFVQVVQLKASAKTNVSGIIEYMVCNDHECMPPRTEKFNVKIE